MSSLESFLPPPSPLTSVFGAVGMFLIEEDSQNYSDPLEQKSIFNLQVLNVWNM